MPTNDSFDPADPLPRFLAGQTGQPPIGDVRGGGVTASRVIMSIVVAIATAAGVTALALGNPVALFSEVTASLVGNPSSQPATAPSPPAIQTADNAPALAQSNTDAKADVETLPPAADNAPASSEVAAAEPAASEPAAQSPTAEDPVAKDPTEAITPSSEALFRRFQAWLSDQDAQAKAEPTQPAQDAAPAQAEPNAPAQTDENVRAPSPHRLAQKHRRASAVHNVPAEMRAQNVRRPIPRTQDARAVQPPVRSVQDARAQEPSAGPNTPAPSFLPPIFGQRN
jgi:hypothetical protein